VIVEIFVAERQAIDPLRQQLRQRVIDKPLVAVVGKAGGQRAGQTEAGADPAQEGQAAIGGERAAGKIDRDLARAEVVEQHRLLGGGGGHKARLWPSFI